MPIYLPAPTHNPGGPDGNGWNRFSLNAGALYPGQCALQPTSYATLWESHDTRRARWGGFDPCVRNGDCTSCPALTPAQPRRLLSFTPDVLVRILAREGAADQPHIMNRPEDGWASFSERWTWAQLAHLEGWRLGDQHRDEHSAGFWLHATTISGGVYGRSEARPCS
ncbi:hypothetical protein ACQPYK_49785 (plasmid) [Streptosporangium sp. CA-135522]|uniref:hypothetical protein n=1 Tax=Streptosporangium sp. CA-135522 TaxID=3240072 RepID=UPI003D8A7AA9